MSLLVATLLLSSSAVSGEWRNGYWAAAGDGHGLRVLRCDATGRGHHGDSLLAGPGLACEGDGTVSVTLDGPRLSLRWTAKGGPPVVRWSVPFRREGFYDADAHRLYLAPDSLDGRPHREVFRKFVGATGHARFVEEFKRVEPARPSSYGGNTRVAPLWLGPSHRLLMCGDRDLGFDLDVTWTGAERLECVVDDDRLTFRAQLSGPLSVRVEPGGTQRVPGGSFEPLRMRFFPDRELTQSLTGKRVSLNALVADFLQQGLYFHPGVITGGDWLHGAVLTHQLDDLRSPYWQQVRKAIVEAANVGYDRCGHFGLWYCWGTSPNYGDGGFLAPSIDARHLHTNWVFIEAASRYILMTGDRALLRARRARWLALDDAPPISGRAATCADPVLVKGDWRIDFRLPTTHTLGQSFTTDRPIQAVRIAAGNHADNAARAVLKLRRAGPGGDVVAEQSTTLAPRTERVELRIGLSAPLPPGAYVLELADAESGRKWDGGLCWWTDPESVETAGEAFNGPFHGDLWALLTCLFDYSYEWFGPRLHGVASYDPAFGCGPNRSGRKGDPIVCVSYWEEFGGGKDLWSSLWYPVACSSMAELARWQGLDAEADRYETLRRRADEAFRRTFGREVHDHGEPAYRYVACVDWDGVDHDYGHTHYNLEAIARGIADPAAGRKILAWLDGGSYSPDGGTTWKRGIYDVWQVVPPFITVNNRDWQGLGGTSGGFPFGEVLGAGGARLSTVLPDLVARMRIHGPDNAWQRALQVLDRYARPDRLTGGRVFADPGGRGRWHFGPPRLDRADIEGFREIFPDNGAAATALPVAFLGLEPTAAGLRMRPRVPSVLDGFEVSGLGCGGSFWRVTARALRAAGQPDRCVVELEPTRGESAGWVICSGNTKCEWKEGKARVVLTGDQSLLLKPPGRR